MENETVPDNYKKGYLLEERQSSDDEQPPKRKNHWVVVSGRDIAFYKDEKSEKRIKRVNLNRFGKVEMEKIYTKNKKQERSSKIILYPRNTKKAKVIFVGPKTELRDWFTCIKSAIDERIAELKLIENSKLNPDAKTFLNFRASEFVPKPKYSSNGHKKKYIEGIWYCSDHFYDTRRVEEIDNAELLIENVPYIVTKKMLISLFAPHGAIKSVNMKHLVNGYVFIVYKDVVFAERAKDAMDGFFVSGLNIRVKFAKQNKAEKEEKRQRNNNNK